MLGRERQIPLPENIKDEATRVQLEERLLDSFVDHLGGIKVSDSREPIINRSGLTELLVQAQREQKKLVFVAIGCQDWLPVPDGDPERDKFMGRLAASHKRVARFSQEMADFSLALKSFRIPHQINFSLSDIEPLLHMELQNMGLTIHNPNREVLRENVAFLAELIKNKGGQIQPFIHSSVLRDLTQVQDLRAFQELIARHPNPEYRHFLDNEYRFDVQHTAPSFVQPHELGPVWLDIQSFSFHDDVISLAQAAQELAPQMPLLSIFPNAGNWSNSRTKPQATFPSRSEVLSNLLGFDRKPETEEEWLRKLRKAKNEPLEQLVNPLLTEIFKIQSVEEKNLAVRIILLLAFGIDPLENEKGNHE